MTNPAPPKLPPRLESACDRQSETYDVFCSINSPKIAYQNGFRAAALECLAEMARLVEGLKSSRGHIHWSTAQSDTQLSLNCLRKALEVINEPLEQHKQWRGDG